MSWVNLENLMDEFPADKEAVEKLLAYFLSMAGEIDHPKYFSYDRIYNISKIQSSRNLILILHRLVEGGLLEQFVRVENNSAGIGDFPTIDEVPNEIYDFRQDINITITPDKLRLYYKLLPRETHAS